MKITVEANNKICFELRNSEGSHYVYVNAETGDHGFVLKKEDIAHYDIASQDKKDILDAILKSPDITLV